MDVDVIEVVVELVLVVVERFGVDVVKGMPLNRNTCPQTKEKWKDLSAS